MYEITQTDCSSVQKLYGRIMSKLMSSSSKNHALQFAFYIYIYSLLLALHLPYCLWYRHTAKQVTRLNEAHVDVEIILPSNPTRSRNCSGNSSSATNPVDIFTHVHTETHTQIVSFLLLQWMCRMNMCMTYESSSDTLLQNCL